MFILLVKSCVYGEWRLWPEAVAGLRWYLSQRPSGAGETLFVTEGGRSLSAQTSGGNRAQALPSAWSQIRQRIRHLEKSEIRNLSFNKLRKTSANAVRRIGSAEAAALFLCHGTPHEDTLLDRYSNRPFDRIHAATEKYREELAPIFASVPEPWQRPKRRQLTGKIASKPPAVVQKVHRMKQQGFTLKKIAEECGLNLAQVRYYLYHPHNRGRSGDFGGEEG